MIRMLLGLLAATLLATPSAAATLRPLTTLAAPVVRLSDLFDDAGTEAQRVLGTAPAPGARIVVGSAQLAAIARQFGVDWRPASPSDRAVLERPGKLMAREPVIAVLKQALVGVGAPDDADIELPGFSPPLIPQEADPHAAIEQLDYDAGSGRFTSILAVSADGMSLLRVRLSGTLDPMVEVPVPAHRLLPGAVIRADDIQMTRVRAGQRWRGWRSRRLAWRRAGRWRRDSRCRWRSLDTWPRSRKGRRSRWCSNPRG